MKLLIITQKVDKDDPILGFFHRWIEEFAKHCESLIVVCLEEGTHTLPHNVRVLSLGKEQSRKRTDLKNLAPRSVLEERLRKLTYMWRFYRHILREQKNYDRVFVHMNQEYVLLGGVVWKFLGKKTTMWRNHFAGSLLTRIAMMISDKIFCTSKFSFTARSKKTILMPVGIDTDFFKKKKEIRQISNSVLFLARFSPAKKVEVIIDALKDLRDSDMEYVGHFYGNPAPGFLPYFDSLKKMVSRYLLNDRVEFFAGIPNIETVKIYNAHTIFINTSPSGMYDKTIFEAMACESLILTSNMNLTGEIHERFLFKENDSRDLAEKLRALLALGDDDCVKYGEELREYVVQKHNLTLLGRKIVECL